MWKIRFGNNVLSDSFENKTHAVQCFMQHERVNNADGDSIKDVGVFVVHSKTFESYKLAYPGEHHGPRQHQIPTCGGGIVLEHLQEMQDSLKAESREESEMFAWLNERERRASVSPKFAKGGGYLEHQVVFFDAAIGWIHAKPGNGLKEAVRNAMKMRINYETLEYFDPAV